MKILFAAVAALALIMQSSHGASIGLDQLIATNGTLTTDGITFSNFGIVTSPGSLPASQITVLTLPTGLQFDGAWSTVGQATTDDLITYTATGPLTGMMLSGNPATTGVGSLVNVTETISGGFSGQLQINSISGVVNNLSSSTSFGTTVSSIQVSKDILNSTPSTGSSSLSFINQTYTTAVPEPPSAVMGCIAISMFCLYKRFF